MKNILIIITLVVICFEAKAKDESDFKDLELFNKILYLVENQYYREVDRKKLIEGALKGMMDTLDPHSAFLNKEFYKKMKDDTDGEFGGLGIEVTQKDGVIYVVTPIEDTPAFKAGIKPRDKIVEVDHESVVGVNLDVAIDKMKGENGKKVHLGIAREGEKGIKHFNIKRKRIKVSPVKYALVDDSYAWIRLTQFQRDSDEYIVKALKKLKKKTKIKGIILDLRSNPGGLLDQAVDISSIFLKDGVVVSTEARDPKNKEIKYVKKSGYKDLKTPLAVLINGRSASASEIVSGALQDHERALIVGSQSFGKGSVQTVARVDEDNGIKLTIAQYMTPKNRKIQAIGITPDIEVPEAASKWIEENLHNDNAIRESDLKNHLTATIETKEERLMRKKLEKDRRLSRSKKSKKKDDDIFRQYSAEDDYQVVQTVKYLKALSLTKKTKL